MGDLDRLWAGWRSEYLNDNKAPLTHDCVFCGLLASNDEPQLTNIVWRSDKAVAILNAFPYGSGHVLVMPVRHAADMEDLDEDELSALWLAVRNCVLAVKTAYRPGGVNVGANLGAAAGAGIPGHMHMHVLPRWSGDTNFMTTVANTRVLPETLEDTWRKVTKAWPSS